MEKRRTRVRFAPSPTGPLHMGGVRTALYNYLYAKQNGGDFIIRIEDTDSHRFVPGAEKYIIEALAWCGIKADEGVDEAGNVVSVASDKHPHAPYRQSERKPIYRQYAEQLVASGNAYYAFDTAEELNAKRAEAEAAGQNFIYNQKTRMQLRNSLTLSAEETACLLAERTDWTVRFKMPENIVDDHLMEISEVIRGEEWLPSLPLHYLLYKAFGWTDSQPRFAHLSLLLKPDGKGKLSKRDGDKLGFPVFPLRWVNPEGEVSRGYREDGYFPEAFVNLLAFLGWNPGDDRELFTIDELIPVFSLDRIVKSGARFNPEKARWYNREYLRMKSDAELAALFMPILEAKGVKADAAYVEKVVALIKERATFVADFWDIASYLFVAPAEFVQKDVDKFWKEENVAMALEAADAVIKGNFDLTKENVEEALEGFIREREWPMGKVMNCLRLALTGASSGLGIADIVSFIGRDEFAARIAFAKEKLS